ncbi:flavin reductase [Actinomadura sp. 7K507]|uniref:flavin reductase n=1 Tax=Actinomadura sp. 7K507 TaxID=2530365 RepID=UPI001FB7021D|nr:flavin reductase [Actinomadura sp. 7K507]
MGVDSQTFRAVLGQWPTGVAVVTTTTADGWHGMTASSFSSVSLDPPMVLVCLARGIHTHTLVERSGVFAVSILGKDQAGIGHRFAGHTPGDRFAGQDWTAAPTGAPVLEDALAWLDCRVAHAYPGGDHTIFVGEVTAAHVPRRTAPLLFHSRAWGQLADPLPESAVIADTGLAAALHRRLRAHGTAPSRVSPDGVAGLLGRVRAAGVRLRLPPVPHEGLPPGGSVLVEDEAELDLVPPDAEAVEIVDGPGAAELVRAVLLRGHAAVGRVPDAFRADRRADVLAAADRLAAAGCAEIALDQGPAAASPLHLRGLLQDVVARTRPVTPRVRLRDSRGLGLVNALTAMKSGVRHFDVTLGGVDGGLCAEDMLFLAAQLEVATPIDRAALAAASAELEAIWGAALPGRANRIAS